jgi:hypothetical protein
MKKIIRLTESDLTRIVRRVIKENEEENIEEPYYTKSYGDPLEFYKNGMLQFALSVNLDDVNEVGWLRRKLDALTKEAEGKLSEEELRKLISHRNKEFEPYISGEEEDYNDELIREEDEDDDDGEKFKLSPEHVINDLNHNVDKFIKSEDLDEEESFRRLDYFIQRDIKPILNKAEEKGLWTDAEIDRVIRYIKNAYNYDYYSGKELPPPNYRY